MAAQFLTSAPCCCTLSIGHNFNGLQCFTAKMSMYYTHYLAAVQKATTTEWLLPSSLRHTSYPSRSSRSQSFPGLSMLLQPFLLFTQPETILFFPLDNANRGGNLCRLSQSPQTTFKNTLRRAIGHLPEQIDYRQVKYVEITWLLYAKKMVILYL